MARLRGVRELDRVDALAKRFRADLDRPLGELSRGNRQKVGLILAVFHSPDLLILDEPTSGLDPLMQEEFLALVREERERGCAVFLSSHELDEVERVCDRVGIIRDGTLIAVERVADLLAKTPRRASIEFSEAVDVNELRGLPGVSDLAADGRKIEFRVAGDIDAVIKAIAAHHVIGLRARPPDPRGGISRLLPGHALIALATTQLYERRRSLLSWGLPLGLWSAFIVSIFPSIQSALTNAVQNYPSALKQAFGIGELSSVEQYLHAEMLSLIVPLAVGYLAVRSIASGLSGAAESGRLDVLLSAPVSRRQLVATGLCATAIELAAVLTVTLALTEIGSLISGAGLSFGPALAGFANVWPLALLAAGLGVVVTGFSLRTSVVTGSVAGVLVAMYVIDLVGRLDPGLDGIRYISVFRYYGNAIEDGIDPWSFLGVVVAAGLLAALGAWLFERRDLAV